jgi:BirA family biotin operon repressor/biotin-[acetyl-CoA-carboxylase] ligase
LLTPPRVFDVVEEIDSTNAEAFRRIEAGDHGPGVVLGLSQTGGRGRRGRRWESAKGGLYFTYYATTMAPLRTLSLVGFVAALAVADVVRDAGAEMVRLKWPNDVLLDGAKLSGILLESSAMPGGGAWFALGIGINLAAAPQGLDQATAGLNRAMTPEEGAQRLMARLVHWGDRLEAEGFEPLRQAWLSQAHGLGEAVNAAAGAGRVEGAFVDLDADGALLLDTPTGRMRITAGEVFFPGRA